MAESCGIPIPVLLAMEEPEIERVLTGGNPAYSDSRFQELKERLPYIASELERKHMTVFLLWREYRMSNPDGYGYTQFCYHVNQYTEAQTPSFVLSPDLEGGHYYAARLHREGSKAVFRYTSLELSDRFALLNAAFGEEGYRV